MARVRLSTTVDEQLLEDARRVLEGKPDSVLIDDALAAFLRAIVQRRSMRPTRPMTSIRWTSKTNGEIWLPSVRLRGRRESHAGPR